MIAPLAALSFLSVLTFAETTPEPLRLPEICSVDETQLMQEHLLNNVYFIEIENLTNDPNISEDCKKTFIDHLTQGLDERLKDGLCYDQLTCPRIEKILEVLAQKNFKEATNKLSNLFYEETSGSLGLLERMVIDPNEGFFGEIPICLIPPACHDPESKECHDHLRQSWLQELEPSSHRTDNERWIASGGFLHLLMSQALVCPQGQQQGGECGIYSGAGIMSHYCATPMRNPNAAPGTCAPQGEGFRCPTTEEFLEKAYSLGAWKTDLCYKNRKTGQINCAPAIENPNQSQEKELMRQIAQARQAGDQKRLKELKTDLARLRRQSGREYIEDHNLSKRQYPKARVSGREGTNLDRLTPVYQEFGFTAIRLKKDASENMETPWETILETLSQGHPVQTSVNINEWYSYEDIQGAGHGIILQGQWTGPNNQRYIAVLESNEPGFIKIFKEKKIVEDFSQNGEGAITLCTPNDERDICSQPEDSP